MIFYILKSIGCLFLLWGFYKIFLEKERVHHFKRFFLLFSLLFALVIPLITFQYDVEIVKIESDFANTTDQISTVFPHAESKDIIIEETPFDYTSLLLWMLYLLGLGVFSFRFIGNLRGILKQIDTGERKKSASYICILLKKKIVPHTFLNYIFLFKDDFKYKKIPGEVLLHEQAHVLQKHTLDILFVEVLHVIFWFNPLFYWLKKAIKLNHEFLADRAVLQQETSVPHYISLLVSYQSSINQTALASPIHYSLTKKRLQMMTSDFSFKKAALKIGAAILVVLGCILFFNNQIIAREVWVAPPVTHKIPAAFESLDIQRNEIIKDASRLIIQDGVSGKEIRKYTNWVQNYEQRQKKEKGSTLQRREVAKIHDIYQRMSSEQKTQVPPFPKSLIPPSDSKSKFSGKSKKPIPPQPPVPPKEVEVKIPRAPQPPNPIEEIEHKTALEMIEEQKVRQVELDKIEEDIAQTMQEAEEARAEAMEAQFDAEIEAIRARKHEMLSSADIEEIQNEAIASIQANRAEIIRSASEAAREATEEARAAIQNAEQMRYQAMKQAQMARKQAMKAAKEARRAGQINMTNTIFSNTTRGKEGSQHFIRKMEQENAEFFYKGKEITAKKAMKIIENSGNRLSIHTKTKNGKSKVKIKD